MVNPTTYGAEVAQSSWGEGGTNFGLICLGCSGIFSPHRLGQYSPGGNNRIQWWVVQRVCGLQHYTVCQLLRCTRLSTESDLPAHPIQFEA